MDADGLNNTAATADYLGLPTSTLHQWAYRGTGPKFYKVGRHRRYRKVDVDQWLESVASHNAPAA